MVKIPHMCLKLAKISLTNKAVHGLKYGFYLGLYNRKTAVQDKQASSKNKGPVGCVPYLCEQNYMIAWGSVDRIFMIDKLWEVGLNIEWMHFPVLLCHYCYWIALQIIEFFMVVDHPLQLFCPTFANPTWVEKLD